MNIVALNTDHYRHPGDPGWQEWPSWADGEPAEIAPAEEAEVAPFDPLDLIELATKRPERKRFAVETAIPLAEVTLLTGEGGTGKSLLAQQIATAAAAGLSCLGLQVQASPSIYLTCEDSLSELHWRQAHICTSLGVGMADLAGKLYLLTLKGNLANELGTFAANGMLSVSANYHHLAATIKTRP
jgi:hypothetical protein